MGSRGPRGRPGKGTGRRHGPPTRLSEFLRLRGREFGLIDPASELRTLGERRDSAGFARVDLQQVFEGIDVFAGVMRAHFDAEGRLTTVQGSVVPIARTIDPEPSLDETYAVRRAAVEVARQRALRPTEVRAANLGLRIFVEGLIEGRPGAAHLVYEVEVSADAPAVRETVFVDAHDGAMVDQLTRIFDALTRRV
jgi:Zn-dependent metalloprotease